MENLLIIIDLHCDASMPSGAEEFGGGNMYSRNLIKCLQRLGIQFIYITRKKFSYLEDKIPLDNKSLFYRLDIGDFGYNDKDVLQKYEDIAFKKIDEIIKVYAKDMKLIFHSFYWQSGMIAYRLSKKYETFYIHSVLSNAERKKMQGAVSDIATDRIKSEHIVFKNAKHIICSSESEYEDMKKLYGIPKEKLHITGRWIDSSYLNPPYFDNGMIGTHKLSYNFPRHYINCQTKKSICEKKDYQNIKSFIYFGRIHPNKGVPQIIKAWLDLYEIYHSEMPPLWIIGGTMQQIDNFKESYFKNNSNIEIAEKEGKIIWWGTLPSEGISTLLLKCHAVIMHSKYEAGGITVVEAMSQGVPLIATPFGFARDYIEDSVNGYIVPFDDLDKLKEKMRYFINQPYLSNYLGRQARSKSEEILNKWDFINLHLKLYGIEEKDADVSQQQINCGKIYKNSVDIFPYCFEIPDEIYIKNKVCKLLNTSIIEIMISDNDKEYIEWTIKTASGIFYFYYLYPLLNIRSIYTGEKPYVFNSCFRMRKALSTVSKNNVVFSSETSGCLLLTQRIEVHI